jgi:hypothetical protein
MKLKKVGEVNSEGALVELTQEDMIKTHNELVVSYLELMKEFIDLKKDYNALLLTAIAPTEVIQ